MLCLSGTAILDDRAEGALAAVRAAVAALDEAVMARLESDRTLAMLKTVQKQEVPATLRARLDAVRRRTLDKGITALLGANPITFRVLLLDAHPCMPGSWLLLQSLRWCPQVDTTRRHRAEADGIALANAQRLRQRREEEEVGRGLCAVWGAQGGGELIGGMQGRRAGTKHQHAGNWTVVALPALPADSCPAADSHRHFRTYLALPHPCRRRPPPSCSMGSLRCCWALTSCTSWATCAR